MFGSLSVTYHITGFCPSLPHNCSLRRPSVRVTNFSNNSGVVSLSQASTPSQAGCVKWCRVTTGSSPASRQAAIRSA